MTNIGRHSILEFFCSLRVDLSALFFAVKQEDIFPELKGLSSFDSGSTSIIFEKNPNTIIGVSLDYNKVLFLKKSRDIPNFKFLRFVQYEFLGESHIAMIYEMDMLKSLSDSEHYSSLLELDILENEESLSLEQEEILFVMKVSLDTDLADSLISRKNLPDSSYDIHSGQFLLDNNNLLICIDPIISTNIDFSGL